MLRLISRLLTLTGIILVFFGFYLVYLRHSPKPLSFENKPGNLQKSITPPNTIEIPSINLQLPIVPAIKEGSNWETTHKGISYLASTPEPGQKGNSVLYGHNWESLLKDLPSVRPGERIFITLKNGDKREFEVEYTAVVEPSESYIINSTNDTRITLYTCTGFLDSKRFVVVAKPVS